MWVQRKTWHSGILAAARAGFCIRPTSTADVGGLAAGMCRLSYAVLRI